MFTFKNKTKNGAVGADVQNTVEAAFGFETPEEPHLREMKVKSATQGISNDILRSLISEEEEDG